MRSARVRGLDRLGKRKWRKEVASFVDRLVPALHLDDAVLGEATLRNSKCCLRVVAPETMATRFSEAFDCGRARAQLNQKKAPSADRRKLKPDPSYEVQPTERLAARQFVP